MSQADFEKAKQRLTQAKQDILWAINVLDDAAKNLSEYKLTPQEIILLRSQFQRDLEEIRTTVERQKFPQHPIVPPSRTIEIGTSRDIHDIHTRITGEARITGEIPPFGDPDEENNTGTTRSIH